MKKILLVSLVALCMLGLLGVGAAVGVYQWAAQDLPNFKSITDYQPPLVTTVYAKDGSILGYFYREKRFLRTLDEMPQHLVRAVLASEDASFYQHEGVDISSILRAALKNVQAGGIVQGGSTITQQVIKKLLLTSEKSYERKLKEAILAYRLERYLSKDEILTIYLNHNFMGARAYGMEAAARTYFGKHVNELTLAECALLAGLPQLPSHYNPLRHPERARQRQRYVLDRMLELAWITPEEHDEALAQELVYRSMDDPSWQTGAYYLEEVRRWLIEQLSEENMKAKGATLPAYGEDAVYELGLHVYTAYDKKHQVAAEAAMREGLEDATRRRGWWGPVTHLEPSAHAAFLAEHPAEVLSGQAPPSAHAEDPGDGPDAAPSQVQTGDNWQQALVTAVSPEGAQVQVGALKAYIGVANMHWARKINPKKATEEVAAVKDATTLMAPGDVVWVGNLTAEELEREKFAVSGPGAELPQLALRQRPRVQGALVSMEPPNGEVRALVGGYSFADSQFNRATQASRQPGSAFKPIVYSTAMDHGFTPASVVMDAPFVYTDYSTDMTWRPENYEGVFYGPTLLRTALAKSRNLVTIRVAQKMGVGPVIERARTMGLKGAFEPNLSVALGSVAVTPINLCQAYTAFARGGSVIEPRIVLKVDTAWGKNLFTSEPVVTEAISPQNAYIMTTLLKEVVQHGTGWRAKELGRPLAGKTGTTNNEQDAWYMGFAPYLLTGVYVGFDQVQPMGKFETGSRAASPIWVAYRREVEEDYPAQDFQEPPGIVHARIDAATGLLAGPNSSTSYFLPFYAGTQPTQTAGVMPDNPVDTSVTGEELMKQVF